jgi:hypothetical protein
VARADEARPAAVGRALLAPNKKPQQQQHNTAKASTIACSASQPCPNPNWSCCAGKCINPARGLACVAKTPCPAAAVCGGLPLGGGWSSSQQPPTCCTADAGVCVSGGTRCCPRERVCGDACCSQGESCGVDANGAARCRSALPRPLLDAAAAKSPALAGKRTAISAAREAGTAGPLLFDEDSAAKNTDAAAERRWRSAGYQEDPCGRATAVLTATRLIGGADGGGGRDLAGAEGRATATVRACCEMCATTPGCGHFSFDGDAGNCWLKAATTGSKPAVAKRLSSAAVVASSNDNDNDAPSLAFAADGGSSSVLQGLWAVPSRAFVSGTLAYAPSPELCPQNRLCSGSGAASCCPGPVASGNNNNAWTCAASGACCAPNSGPPCGSGCGCGPGFQCSSQGRCVASQAAAMLPPQQQKSGGGSNTATAALLNQQAVLSQQPAGSVVNYAAAYNPGMALVLVQDPSDPQACHARADATLNGGNGNNNANNAAFAFRTNTMIAPRSGGALNRDRPTLAATAAACCLQCAGVANCAHFSWDGGAMACSLYSDRAGADGAAKATRLEVARPGSVTGDMIPKLGLMSAEAGSQAAAAAAAEAAGARCASPCGDEGLCCDAAREACLAPTGLPGLAGTQHTCCPREAVCGKQCGCESGSSCVGGNTCCPASRACGNTCCAPSDRCSADGKCVRDTGGGGGGGGLQVISGNGVGGPYNRGFVGNWAGAQYTATALPAGEGRR